MKKTIAFLLALALLVSLCACGSKTEVATGGEITLNGDEIYPIACEDELEYWSRTSTWTQDYQNFGDTPLGKEVAKQTGVKVKYMHPQEGQGTEQFNIMLASNELPDIVECDWTTSYPGGPEAAINEDVIYDLTDIIDKWSPAFKKTLESNEDWDKMSKTNSGKYFAYQFIRGDEILTVGAGLCVRGDWLKKAGLAVPETISEWEEALTVFKDKFGATKPIASNNTKTAFMGAFGVWSGFYVDDGVVKYGQYEDGYKDFLALYSDWYKKGLIDPDVMSSSGSSNLNSDMLNNKVGVAYAWAGSGIGRWLAAKDTPGMDPDFDVVAAPVPVMNKGEVPEFGFKDNPVIPVMATAISKNCKNVELAARFLDYGYTEKGNLLFNFGVEGESFNMVGDYPTYTEKITESGDLALALACYTRASSGGLMVQRKEYIEQYYQTQQQKDALEVFNKTNMTEHKMPPVTIDSAVSDEYSSLYASISTYVEEEFIKFLRGDRSLDTFDAYKKQLEDFGIKRVLEIQQQAYDAYLKR